MFGFAEEDGPWLIPQVDLDPSNPLLPANQWMSVSAGMRGVGFPDSWDPNLPPLSRQMPENIDRARSIVELDQWDVSRGVNNWQLLPQQVYDTRHIVALDDWDVTIPPTNWLLPDSIYATRHLRAALDYPEGDSLSTRQWVAALLGGTFDTGTCAAAVGSGPCIATPVTCCDKAKNLLGALDASNCSRTCDSIQSEIQTNCTIFNSSHADDVALRGAAQCVNSVWYGSCAQPSYITCGTTCTATSACSSICPSGTCPTGEVCQGGTCVNQSCACSTACPTGTCPTGQTCQGGVCATTGGGLADNTLLIFGGIAVAALIGAVILTNPGPAPAAG